ncbi:putative 3-dehydroquinate dehydratase [Planktothrix serta PCC 8927]|uniref:3-dehydroquinate dehydratase n=1 Tax=Planktothrix serta PCC 8927 TaxID=671068 RepID=A0A7Z9BHM0_9CYAN|nr:ADP-ribosylglycohydrolase family protein [Planktothrix serta]VXD13987.1 putative 3-dehydroquinate dehydratase [Planktothrix serta PCC 8927]
MKQDSLYSQFQGAVLGVAIGYELGQRWLKTASVSHGKSSGLSVNWGQRISQLTQSLIQCQGFDPVDYWKVGKIETEKPRHRETALKQSLLLTQGLNSGSEVALVGLPLALFFHDNLRSLQQLGWNQSEEEAYIQDGVLVMAGAIAEILTQNPKPQQLIPNLLPKLRPETALTAKLEQVQTLLQQRASLETAVRQLTQTSKASSFKRFDSNFDPENWTAFALGLYCFLSTPDDYSLTVLRSLQTGYHPEITAAISGALSGAYQGLMGISVQWRLTLQIKSLYPQADAEIENDCVESKNYERELLQLANNLFAVWLGVYR